MILTQQLIVNSSKDLSKAAIRYLGKDITFNEFRTRVSKISYLLIHEIGHNARVAFLTRNSPATAISFFALTNSCSVVIPVDPDKSPAEIAEWIRTTKATHIAVTSDLVTRARDIMIGERLNLPIIEIEKKQGGEYDASFTPAPDHTPKENDIAVIFRTGGVSGKPKYITMNHKQLYGAAQSLKTIYHLNANDRITTPMNWAHPYAFIHGFLFPIMMGGTVVIDHGMENKEYLEFISDSRTTRIVGTPPSFLKLLLACRSEKRGIPSVRSVTVGLGQLQPELQRAFQALKIAVSHCYGQAEAGWTICMEDPTEPADYHQPGGVGKPLMGFKYKVMDEQFDEKEGDSREGYLAMSGPSLMTAYLDREKDTKSVLRGTWLYTGDYVRLEGEGDTMRITFLGRRDELIIDNGTITSVVDIDWALKGAPGVEDGAGFTLKDQRGRPIVAVAVVKVQNNPLNEKAVIDLCSSKLSGELVPKVVVFTDTIPRDAGGNVNRIKLKAQFAGTAG